MKRICLLTLFAFVSVFAYAQCNWRLGLELITGGNKAPFAGGMDAAHANFHHGEHGTAAFRVNFQRPFSRHWYGQIGIGIAHFGFRDAISKNYSFLSPDKRWTGLGTKIHQLELPVTAIYKFNENCRNVRWFVGAGFALAMNGKGVDTDKNVNDGKDEVATEDGNLNQRVIADPYAVVTGHIMGGIEKRLKRNGLLNVGLYLNPAFKDIARSEVSYTLDGTDYDHEFRNRGSYAGLMVNYYFPKFGSRKVKGN